MKYKKGGGDMGRERNPSKFASLETKKLNRSCPHYQERFCVRQRRLCSNKDPFYENCIVFKGNGMLNAFMHQRRRVVSGGEVNKAVAEEEPLIIEEVPVEQAPQ